MRAFFKKVPTFWAGRTGRAIRRLKPRALAKDCMILADFLTSAPAANQYGLYVLEPEVVGVYTPLSEPEFETAMAALVDLGFCRYEDGWVWVVEMAKYQLGAPLKPRDKQVPAVKRWYRTVPRNPHLGPFFDRYDDELLLSRELERVEAVERREGHASPFDAPSKGLSMSMSLSPSGSEGVEGGVGGDGEFALAPPAGAAKPRRKATTTWRTEAFEHFWHAYPKKTERRRAFEAFTKAVKTPEQAAEVQAGLERLLPYFDYSEGGRWIPAPYKWLERERWHDEVTAVPQMTSRTQQTMRAVAAAKAGGPGGPKS